MLLAINTCGQGGSVALGRIEGSGVAVLGLAEIAARAASAELVPKISSLLSASGASLNELQALVVVNGPGSFTGIRVALSTAKGLAQPAGLPLVALSRLRVLAGAGGQPDVLAACDAGRGEYYAGKYKAGRMVWEKLLSRQELEAEAASSAAGAFLLEDGAKDDFRGFHPRRIPPPDAAGALRSAVDPFRAGEFADLEALDGNYLRRSGKELFGIADPGPAPPGLDGADSGATR